MSVRYKKNILELNCGGLRMQAQNIAIVGLNEVGTEFFKAMMDLKERGVNVISVCEKVFTEGTQLAQEKGVLIMNECGVDPGLAPEPPVHRRAEFFHPGRIENLPGLGCGCHRNDQHLRGAPRAGG